jgi:hypothetical protein
LCTKFLRAGREGFSGLVHANAGKPRFCMILPDCSRALLGVWAFFAAFPVSSILLAVAPERLPRENLLLWRDKQQVIHPVRTPAEWEHRRREIQRGFESVIGAMPDESRRSPLEVRIEEEVDRGSYLRRKISYQAEPNSWVPAYVCIPKAALASGARVPGVLCLHPTDSKVGHGVVVGLAGTSSFYANREYASQLAEAGCVTISPSYPLLAGYQPDLDVLGHRSGTMKAIWDNRRALDVLDALPFVRSGSYAAIGHSLGGHNAVFTAFFEPRIQVVVSSCGLDSFLDYQGGNPAVWKPEKGWCQKRYMPGLLGYDGRLPEIPFDFHELVGSLAPRAVFISAPLHDSNFRSQSVDRVADTARQVYRLLGKPDSLRVAHPDCAHDFPDATRSAAYAFILEHLGHPGPGGSSAP